MSRDKELLRTWLKKKRLAMDKETVRAYSEVIGLKLLNFIKWENIKSLNIYQPIESLNEIDTAAVIKTVKDKYPAVEITLQNKTPASVPADKKYDVIVVPTLGFDTEGHRLGWGGGFYDRFLADQPQALKIGLCFRMGYISRGLPHEPHDIKLDKVITEV